MGGGEEEYFRQLAGVIIVTGIGTKFTLIFSFWMYLGEMKNIRKGGFVIILTGEKYCTTSTMRLFLEMHRIKILKTSNL